MDTEAYRNEELLLLNFWETILSPRIPIDDNRNSIGIFTQNATRFSAALIELCVLLHSNYGKTG